MDQDREAWVRQRAYERWEADGRPDGEHERHWREAESGFSPSVDAELSRPFQNGSAGLEVEEEKPPTGLQESSFGEPASANK